MYKSLPNAVTFGVLLLFFAGCVSQVDPNLTNCTVKSLRSEGYKIWEISTREIWYMEQENIESRIRLLQSIRREFADNAAVVSHITEIISNLRLASEWVEEGYQEEAAKLSPGDRLFRYIRETEDDYRKGIFVIRDGEIIFDNASDEEFPE